MCICTNFSGGKIYIYAKNCYKFSLFEFDGAKLMFGFEKMKKCKHFFGKTRKKFI